MANETTETSPPEKRSTALLAEDDPMIRELVAMYLDRMGYRVLEAQNGKEAIAYLQSPEGSETDLIVTDLLMPEAGGAEVIKIARNEIKCDKILIISGYANDLDFLEDSMNRGSLFLRKPFTYAEFETKVLNLQEREAS